MRTTSLVSSLVLSALTSNVFGAPQFSSRNSPHGLSARGTDDNMCGAANGGKNCLSMGNTHLCCSQYGWCGDTPDHCGEGCQPQYGICSGAPVPTTPSNPTPTLRVSDDNSCGANNGGMTCVGGSRTEWFCCSQHGWCGDTDAYCGAGCQEGFGRCNSGSSTTTANPGPTTTPAAPRPNLGNVPYGVEIYSCSVPNTFAITYDDGPYHYTSDLLDILKENNVKATFFVTGDNLDKGAIDAPGSQWSSIIQRMDREGHQIASHTWSHADLAASSEATIRYEMVRLEQALVKIIKKYPTYMRPPYIRTNPLVLDVLGSLGYHVIIWDLDTDDYNNRLPSQFQNSFRRITTALDEATPGRSFNLIQHDIHAHTVYNLTQFEIDVVKMKNQHRFVTIGECLGDPPSNWYRTAL